MKSVGKETLINKIGLRFSSLLDKMTTLFKAHTRGLCSVRAGSLPPIGWSLRVFSFLWIVQNKRRQRGRVFGAPDLKSVGRGFKSRSDR